MYIAQIVMLVYFFKPSTTILGLKNGLESEGEVYYTLFMLIYA